jgi:alanine racemase
MSNQWIEVDASRLARNVQALRAHIGPQALLAPVVKSNGYGHGLERAARAFTAGGADWLCVHDFREAQRVLELRLDRTVLMMGPVAPDERAAAVAAGVHLTVTTSSELEALAAAASAAGRCAFVHLKIETGTHRQGMEEDELGACLRRIRESEALELIGLHSHFANIEDTTRHEYASRQLERFERALRLATEAGVPPRIRHIASSAAAILFSHTRYDLVRPGIAAYGFWPSRETLVSAREQGFHELDLAPALTWKARLTQVKQVPAGSFIGYGCADKVEVDSQIAVIPIGYADGYRRAMSGRAHVLIRGRRCPVRGRICMNLIMVDVSHLEGCEVGEEAVLLGHQGAEEISAEQLADWAGTIHYEVISGLGTSIPRRDPSG